MGEEEQARMMVILVNLLKRTGMLITLIMAMALSGCGGVGTDAPGLNYQKLRRQGGKKMLQ